MLASPIFIGTGFDPMDSGSSRAKIEWLLEAKPGARIKLTARQERSGRVSATVVCE